MATIRSPSSTISASLRARAAPSSCGPRCLLPASSTRARTRRAGRAGAPPPSAPARRSRARRARPRGGPNARRARPAGPRGARCRSFSARSLAAVSAGASAILRKSSAVASGAISKFAAEKTRCSAATTSGFELEAFSSSSSLPDHVLEGVARVLRGAGADRDTSAGPGGCGRLPAPTASSPRGARAARRPMPGGPGCGRASRHVRVEHGEVGGERFEVERACDVEGVEQPSRVRDRECGEPGREGVVVDEPDRLAGGERDVSEEGMHEIGVRGEVGLTQGAEHAAPAATRRRSARRRCARRARAGHRSSRLRARSPGVSIDARTTSSGAPLPWPIRWLRTRLRSNSALSLLGDGDALPRCRDPVVTPYTLRAPFDRLFDDRSCFGHTFESNGGQLHRLAVTSDAYDVLDREVLAREDDGHAQTTRAVSAIVSQLRPLVFDRERVPDDRRPEPALRRQREALERAVGAGLRDPRPRARRPSRDGRSSS